ncbi:MAG: hypothetical protein OXL98_03465, partial [Acidimicrobiaceae bacterium]|nr:hypothetical protein [Acidimicrobiaceae bacterium]
MAAEAAAASLGRHARVESSGGAGVAGLRLGARTLVLGSEATGLTTGATPADSGGAVGADAVPGSSAGSGSGAVSG